jgi:RNA polymerase sigma-70 factor (ECF subfamily)
VFDADGDCIEASMHTHSGEADLVGRLKSGDQSAFTQVYERYGPAIYRYIYYRVGEVEVAEDLQSEVFLRMLEGIERYEDRGWPISAWLYRIAHDRTIDTIRRRRARRHVSLESWSGAEDGPEAAFDSKAEYDEVAALLAHLTYEQQQVITMRFSGGMSIQEVAARLGRSEGSVKALQYRGLQSLARLLETQTA